MMSNIFLLACFILCTSMYCQCATYIREQLEKPGRPNQCYNDDETVFYNAGEVIRNRKDDQCVQETCIGKSDANSKYVQIDGLSCPPMPTHDQCRPIITQDLLQDYPGCCPRLVCQTYT